MHNLFHISYIVGFVLATGFATRYHMLTRGAWREHQTGVSFMGMAVALAVVLFAAVIRVLAVRVLEWHWADRPTLFVALAGVVAVNGFLGHRWYLLERYQKDNERTSP